MREGGKFTVGPPDGEHDDCVMSTGLAVLGSVKNNIICDLTGFDPDKQRRLQEDIAQRPRPSTNSLGMPTTGDGMPTFFDAGFSSPFTARDHKIIIRPNEIHRSDFWRGNT